MAETLSEFKARLDGAAIATYLMVMLVVPLKLWCRVAPGKTSNLGWDDAICILALLPANAFFYVSMLGNFQRLTAVPLLICNADY